jgi:zinc transport system substrate-binding protein
MSTKSLISTGIVAVFLVIVLVVFAPSASDTISDSEKIRVSASFYPLAFIAEHIGGEHVQVTNMTPAGGEPHDFEPTPREVTMIYDSDLFLFNGGGIDAWASMIANELESQGVLIFQASSFIPYLLDISHDHAHEHDHEHEEDVHREDKEAFDEHFWLDPNLVIIQAEVIRDMLIDVDPINRQDYEKNTEEFIGLLQELDEAYTNGLAQCELRVVITSHAAFAYLAEAYDFKMISIAGVSPHDEPSAGVLAEIAREAEEWGVEYIFFETLVSPKLANALAREIGAQTLAFEPVGGLTQDQLDSGLDYFAIMETNLENLRTAMLCQ